MVVLPESRARLIALDLVELDRLRAHLPLLEMEITTKDQRITTLQTIADNRQRQIELSNRLAESYRVELEAERQIKKGDNVFTWVVRLAAALGVGYIIGSL